MYMIRVIVVDDDNFVTASLKTILEAQADIEVIAIGNSAKQAIALYDSYIPHLLLIDIRMGDMSGLDAAAEIISKHPDAKVVFLTTFNDDEYIVKALRIGAKGYLIKQNIESVIVAIRSVMSGQSVFGDEVTSKLPLFMNRSNKLNLTKYGIGDREMAIIELVAQGQNNKEIADSLFLSEGTVRNYLSTILEKLSLRDRTQIAIMYYRNGVE